MINTYFGGLWRLQVRTLIVRKRAELRDSLADPLLKNSIHLILTTFLTSALGFLFWYIAARFYPSAQVGLASAAISSMNLMVMFSLLGFNISLIRFLPNSPKKETIMNSCFTLAFMMSIIISIIYLISLDYVAPSLSFLRKNFVYELSFIGFTGIWSITTLISSVLISNRTAEYVLVKELIFGLSKMPVPILMMSAGAFGIFFSWGAGLAIAVVIGFIFLLKINPSYRPKALIDRETVNNIFSYSSTNYIANLFYMAPALILPTMVATLLSPDKAAYFYISWMIANLLFTIPVQASQSLFAEGSNKEDLTDAATIRSAKYILFLLIPSVVFILILGDKLLLSFGKEYSNQGLHLLQLLAVSAIPYSIGSIFAANKRIKKENTAVILIYGLLAIITLTGSYLLLEQKGLIGIGYAWILGNIIIASCLLFSFLIKRFSNKCQIENNWRRTMIRK